MRSGRDHVKTLGLRWLGLAPVARGRSRGIYVAARGRLWYPEGSATGSHWDPPYLSPLLIPRFLSLTTLDGRVTGELLSTVGSPGVALDSRVTGDLLSTVGSPGVALDSRVTGELLSTVGSPGICSRR